MTFQPKGKYAHVKQGPEECYLRGIILKTAEVPGRLPPDVECGRESRTPAMVREMALAVIAGGVTTISRILGQTGYPERTRAAMDAMVDEGILRVQWRGKKAFYMVAK